MRERGIQNEGYAERLKIMLGRLSDSPNFTQDLLSMLTPSRMMVWFTALNLGLGFVLFVIIATTKNFAEVSQLIATRGLGHFVAIMILIVLGGAFTIFVPIRTSGLIFMPRLSRYMDQIVLSGISPTRYFFGRLLSVNVFALAFFVATIPYFVFAVSMGGVHFGFILTSLLALVVYANVLVLATLAGSLSNFEIFSTPGVIFTFCWVYVLGLIPLPGFPIGAFTPARLFVEPMYGGMGGIVSGLSVSTDTLSFHVPSIVLFLGFYGFLAAILLTWIASGPLNCISLPNSMFGEVIMPGESKRKSVLRRFFLFRRKSEICFLYENRSDWVRKYELFLRWGRSLFLIFLGIVLAVVAIHLNAHRCDPNELTGFLLTVFMGSALFAGALFSHDKSTEKTMIQGGPLKITAGAVSAISFAATLLFATCATILPPIIRLSLQGEAWLDAQTESTDILFAALWVLPLMLVTIIHLYAFQRWFAMSHWDFGKSTLLFLVYIGAVMVIPFLPIGIFHGLPNHIAQKYGAFEKIAAALSYLSPVPHFLSVLAWEEERDSIGPAIFAIRKWAPILTYIFQTSLATLFVILAIKRHRRLDPWGKH